MSLCRIRKVFNTEHLDATIFSSGLGRTATLTRDSTSVVVLFIYSFNYWVVFHAENGMQCNKCSWRVFP